MFIRSNFAIMPLRNKSHLYVNVINRNVSSFRGENDKTKAHLWTSVEVAIQMFLDFNVGQVSVIIPKDWKNTWYK